MKLLGAANYISTRMIIVIIYGSQLLESWNIVGEFYHKLVIRLHQKNDEFVLLSKPNNIPSWVQKSKEELQIVWF